MTLSDYYIAPTQLSEAEYDLIKENDKLISPQQHYLGYYRAIIIFNLREYLHLWHLLSAGLGNAEYQIINLHTPSEVELSIF